MEKLGWKSSLWFLAKEQACASNIEAGLQYSWCIDVCLEEAHAQLQAGKAEQTCLSGNLIVVGEVVDDLIGLKPHVAIWGEQGSCIIDVGPVYVPVIAVVLCRSKRLISNRACCW